MPIQQRFKYFLRRIFLKDNTVQAEPASTPCCGIWNDASKRVRRFERPTFTLATCKSTELTQSITPISSDFEKGVTETVTSSLHDEALNQLVANWQHLPEHIKLAIQALVRAGGSHNGQTVR